MSLPILEFVRAFSTSIARVMVSAARAARDQTVSELNAAWLYRNASIFRQRSVDLMDFADSRLRIGPNGASWMTPEEQALFQQFNSFYWRVLSKAEGTAAVEKNGPALRRTAQAAATKVATAAVGRRRRNAPPASRRTKRGEE